MDQVFTGVVETPNAELSVPNMTWAQSSQTSSSSTSATWPPQSSREEESHHSSSLGSKSKRHHHPWQECIDANKREPELTSLNYVVNLASSLIETDLDSCDSAKRVGPFFFRVFLVNDDNINAQNKNDKNVDEGSDDYNRPSESSTEDIGNTRPIPVVVSDGVVYCAATILYPIKELMTARQCIIAATGLTVGIWDSNDPSTETGRYYRRIWRRYVPSSATSNQRTTLPFLYIMRFQVASENDSEDIFNPTNSHTPDASDEGVVVKNNESSDIQLSTEWEWSLNCGKVATALASKEFDLETFAGECPQTTQRQYFNTYANKVKDAAIVSDFLEQHHAIQILHKSKHGRPTLLIGSLNSSSLSSSAQESFQNYQNSLLELDRTQREKIGASVQKHLDQTNCEPNSEQAAMQFQETLEYALNCKDELLTSEMLVRWHLWLMGDGLHENAGEFRDHSRQQAGTEFCSPDQIQPNLDKLCQSLEFHWIPQVNAKPTSSKEIATLAAAALVGIWDICPFHDGNLRFGLVLVNWALRRCGLPFCIHILDDNKGDGLVSVLQQTLRNLYQVSLGDTNPTGFGLALNTAGGLAPLVTLLLSHMASAVSDLSEMIKEKEKWTTDEAHARIVRRAREAAVETLCFVCFEGSPNISTLCCGKPVHFNCLAQWLSSHASCPQCRSNIPSLTIGNSNSWDLFHRATDDEDSEVGRFLHFITDDPDDDSSSDSWSSSSSSSSDSSPSSDSSSSSSFSPPSAFLDNGFDSSSAENDEEEEDEARSRRYRWISGTGDDSEGHPFFNADLAPMEGNVVEIYDVDLANHLSQEHSSTSVSRVLPEAIDDTHHENQHARNVSQSIARMESFSHSNSGITPRMSFLDPRLLVNVQRSNEERDESTSVFVDSSSTGDDDHGNHEDMSETMLFARNPAFNPVTPESIPRDGAEFSSNLVVSDHWLSPHQYDAYESDDYDPETFDDEEFFVPHEEEASILIDEAPSLCTQSRCHNHAHAECRNKSCYSCCVKRGADCPVHGLQFVSTLFNTR
ncbi:Fic/DOC family protein [Nitzschia inconspicua]|uniref:Fic/DOC family protein n=1 Tax=Nitzschia inconspicua TaxID=303405 RepID=A0A9K3LKQ4_9STRA|nr:Fic/DOC family protein [Nitzschia inconspicua]